MKKIIDFDSKTKKQAKEAKTLYDFHNKMRFIRRQVENAQTVDQLNNVVKWFQTILKQKTTQEELLVEHRKEVFKDWFLFLSDDKMCELSEKEISSIRKK